MSPGAATRAIESLGAEKARQLLGNLKRSSLKIVEMLREDDFPVEYAWSGWWCCMFMCEEEVYELIVGLERVLRQHSNNNGGNQ